jgi:glycosyltransferase involved in cell wall biosynthesis
MLFDQDQEVHLSDRLTLQILRGCGYQKNISLARYIDHRIIAHKFRILSSRLDTPDVIVASMPCHHLAYEAMLYAKQNHVPMLVDIRDQWPDIFLDAFKNPLVKKLGEIILFQDFRRLKYLLSESNGILAMSHTILEWARKKTGYPIGPFDKVFFTGYKPFYRSDTDYLDIFKHREKQKMVVYVGTFGQSYELPLVVDAALKFNEAGRNDVFFVFAGTGEQEMELRRKSRDLVNVVFTGWISAEKIKSLLCRAWIGIVPCRSVGGAIPNKVFEYLSEGIPLVSSLEGEMAEYIDVHKLGMNYRPGDLNGLIRGIATILDNPELREEMSSNALRFYREYGDADVIYTAYAEHIERLCAMK